MINTWTFAGTKTTVDIRPSLPGLDEIKRASAADHGTVLMVADTNTVSMAKEISAKADLCVIAPGERNKNWSAVEEIIRAARNAAIGRDGLIVAVGGGVVTDIAAFAASIYMRGIKTAFVSTTLLGMVDASVGGKTGIDLLGLKNFAGTFYPASAVFMPVRTLSSLPEAEFKSGFAELIKTAILNPENSDDKIFDELRHAKKNPNADALVPLIENAVRIKASIVEKDPRETGLERILLNLGHSFGHALETAAGLGDVTHGEAVAWGTACACRLGTELQITSKERARRITSLLADTGYEISIPHPAISSSELFKSALLSDKKNREGTLTLIVPGFRGACPVTLKREEFNKVCAAAGYA